MSVREILLAQLLLRDAGKTVRLDARPGPKTSQAIQEYQQESGLTADSVCGPITLSALIADGIVVNTPLGSDAWNAWRGSLGLIVHWEGHSGVPYVPPGGHSGVTLDPGFDLRFHTHDELSNLYGQILEPFSIRRLAEWCGKIGNPGMPSRFSNMKISRDDAATLLPRIAEPYWSDILDVCDLAALRAAPAPVHTALLSLCYNAGKDDIVPLRRWVNDKEWAALADAIASIPKIEARRTAEANLIHAALD